MVQILLIDISVIFLIILFLVIITVIFIYFESINRTRTHKISIINNTNASQTIKVITELDSFDNITLDVNQQVNYYATPNCMFILQSIIDDNVFTQAKIIFAGANYDNTNYITNGSKFIKNLPGNTNIDDIYGISLQDGYSIQMDIIPLNTFDNSNMNSTFDNDTFINSSTKPYYCSTPKWFNSDINCPVNLENNNACSSACSVFNDDIYCCTNNCNDCQKYWDNPRYYQYFKFTCPTCLITNCDNLNYSCNTYVTNIYDKQLTNYKIILK